MPGDPVFTVKDAVFGDEKLVLGSARISWDIPMPFWILLVSISLTFLVFALKRGNDFYDKYP